MPGPALRIGVGFVELAVRLTPRAHADQIVGVDRLADGSEIVLVRVRALPESGEANAALVKLVARSFAVPRSAVSLIAGAKQRIKRLRIEGPVPALQAAFGRLGPASGD